MPLSNPPVYPGPFHRASHYYVVGDPTGSPFGGTDLAVTKDKVWYVPYVPGPLGISVTRAVFEVTAAVASTVGRVGFYADAGGFPGALLLDGGTASSASGGAKEITLPSTVRLNGGVLYWLAFVSQAGAGGVEVAAHSGYSKRYVGNPSANTDNVYAAYTEAGVTGALPATATPAAAGDSNAPGLLLRAA